MNIKELTDRLARPINTELVKFRAGSTNKRYKKDNEPLKAVMLAYIDARVVMDILDDACGIENWQCRYSHADTKTICEIGIRINGEWVWKANGAGDSDVEPEKGAISDSLKRCGVLWKIGRDLYNFPKMWGRIIDDKGTFHPDDLKKASSLLKKNGEINFKAYEKMLKEESEVDYDLEDFNKNLRPEALGVFDSLKLADTPEKFGAVLEMWGGLKPQLEKNKHAANAIKKIDEAIKQRRGA